MNVNDTWGAVCLNGASTVLRGNGTARCHIYSPNSLGMNGCTKDIIEKIDFKISKFGLIPSNIEGK